jgi:hypothetical protein
MEIDPIKVEYFCKSEEEKTKLNWFCYEYAYRLYDQIRNNFQLRKFCEQKGQRSITMFCVHFSKEMKKTIADYFERPEGQRRGIEYSYVDSFYPRISIKMTNRLVKMAEEAWNDHMFFCVDCSTRCISEKDEYCELFDDYAADGLL